MFERMPDQVVPMFMEQKLGMVFLLYKVYITHHDTVPMHVLGISSDDSSFNRMCLVSHPDMPEQFAALQSGTILPNSTGEYFTVDNNTLTDACGKKSHHKWVTKYNTATEQLITDLVTFSDEACEKWAHVNTAKVKNTLMMMGLIETFGKKS